MDGLIRADGKPWPSHRRGTAVNRLLFEQPLRDSEDMDLVQAQPEPIGGMVAAIGAALSWLGKCSREQAGHSMHLVLRFTPEVDAQLTLKLEVEINAREHASFLGVRRYPFAVESDWYCAKTEIAFLEPEELFGTKLRALLQRRRTVTCSICTSDSSSRCWLRRESLPASTTTWPRRASRSRV
jgi:hypothetical protein